MKEQEAVIKADNKAALDLVQLMADRDKQLEEFTYVDREHEELLTRYEAEKQRNLVLKNLLVEALEYYEEKIETREGFSKDLTDRSEEVRDLLQDLLKKSSEFQSAAGYHV